MNPRHAQYLTLAKDLALKVGQRIREELASSKSIEIELKGKSDPVTEIDRWSEAVIAEAIYSAFPQHKIIGEETSAEELKQQGLSMADALRGDCVWVVDPLDGTNNFSNKLPHCGVSIAVLEKGERVLGVVYDPARQEMFEAVKGGGAFLNSRQLQVTQKQQLIQSIVATGFPNDRWTKWDEYKELIDRLIMNFRQVRSLGAAALEYCWLACGRLDAFLEFNLKPWDVAAGSLIAEEAGAHCSTILELSEIKESELNLLGRGFLACSPALKEEFYTVLKN